MGDLKTENLDHLGLNCWDLRRAQDLGNALFIHLKARTGNSNFDDR